jgi:hypothetical protein
MAFPSEKPLVLEKLKKHGVTEARIDSELPRAIKGGWRLVVEKNEIGNTIVEYTKPGEVFPVSFVCEDPQEAKGLMVLYLRENRAG